MTKNGRSAFYDYAEVSQSEWETAKGEILQENATFSEVKTESANGIRTDYYYMRYNEFIEDRTQQYFGYTICEKS